MFTVTCDNCGNKQNLSDLINNVGSNPNILIDLTFEDYDDHENDNIIFKCFKCGNSFEF